MKYLIYISVSIFFMFSCKNADTDEVVELKPPKPGSTAELIMNPAEADGSLDTVNIAKFEFDSMKVYKGIVKQGDFVRHTFKFRNIGKRPLLINDARSNCGCTIPTWPKNPIAPGDTASIYVVFDSKNKMNRQKKPVIITANTFPAETRVYLLCEVIKK